MTPIIAVELNNRETMERLDSILSGTQDHDGVETQIVEEDLPTDISMNHNFPMDSNQRMNEERDHQV